MELPVPPRPWSKAFQYPVDPPPAPPAVPAAPFIWLNAVNVPPPPPPAVSDVLNEVVPPLLPYAFSCELEGGPPMPPVPTRIGM